MSAFSPVLTKNVPIIEAPSPIVAMTNGSILSDVSVVSRNAAPIDARARVAIIDPIYAVSYTHLTLPTNREV